MPQDERARVLVVANRTAESDELLAALRERAAQGPAAFALLVPSSPHGVTWAADMHAGGKEAEQHKQAALDRIRKTGIEMLEATVGDPDPIAAVQDAVNFADYDEIIVSTLPTHLSKWLKLDLPNRVARVTGLPVKHVVGSEA